MSHFGLKDLCVEGLGSQSYTCSTGVSLKAEVLNILVFDPWQIFTLDDIECFKTSQKP